MIPRKIFSSVMSVFAFLAICSVSYAAELFVDRNLSSNCTSGNYSIANRNCSGRDGNGYTSIQSAVNASTAGDTITVRGGVYQESVVISKQGTASAYITLRAYSGETVRLDGRNTVPYSWTGLLHLQNCRYLKIEGVQFSYSKYMGFQAVNSHNVIIERCEAANNGHGGIVFSGGSNNIVRQCVSHHNNQGPNAGHEAISLEGVDTFEVVGCTVHDNREEGIDAKYGSKNGRIHHNKVYNNNGPNIYVDSSSNIEVYNNEVFGANKAGIGISVEYAWNANRDITHDLKIYNNIIYDNGLAFWFWIESGAESFAQFSDIFILNNVVHANNRANWGGNGVYIDQGGGSGNYGSNLVVRNNIFWDNTAQSGSRTIADRSGALGKFTVDYNLFKQGQPSATYGTAAVMTTDVRFVDITARNYRLQSVSPAINAGSSSLAPAFDFDDAPRSGAIDIGAYEYQQQPTQGVPGAPGDLRIVQ